MKKHGCKLVSASGLVRTKYQWHVHRVRKKESGAEMEMGQWVMGHWPVDPWWWNNCAVDCAFLFLVLTIRNCSLTQLVQIIIAGGLICDILLSKPRGLSSTTMPRRLLDPCAGLNDVMAIGHGSCGSWVNCVMGLMGHGSRKMTHFHLWSGVFQA